MLALVGSGGWGVMASSCIIPDTCIVVIDYGTDWCVDIVGAQMWPPGRPDLAEPVVDEDGELPRGCICYNDAENEILESQEPLEVFAKFFADLRDAARDDCDYQVPQGWTHNCYDNGPGGPAFITPGSVGTGTCVGDCSYAAVPKDGCGPDPSPYECEAEYGGGETGAGGDDGGAGGVTPGDLEWQL
jgi:hypothetical protein